MGAPWPLCEARLVQTLSSSSAANADQLPLPAVPAGKVWVVLGVGYFPSVAETQTISFEKIERGGNQIAILNPTSLALQPAVAGLLEQGMEYLLLPSEYIIVRRGNHTAGSTMQANIQFVEIDLPLYTYDEPQVVKRQDRAISSIRQRLGGGSSVTRAPSDLGGDRGGRTGPLPK